MRGCVLVVTRASARVANFFFAVHVEVRPRAEEVINMPQKMEIFDIDMIVLYSRVSAQLQWQQRKRARARFFALPLPIGHVQIAFL